MIANIKSVITMTCTSGLSCAEPPPAAACLQHAVQPLASGLLILALQSVQPEYVHSSSRFTSLGRMPLNLVVPRAAIVVCLNLFDPEHSRSMHSAVF